MIIVQCTLQSYFELNHIRRFVPPQEMEPETKEAYQPQVPACSGASMGEKNRLRFFFTEFTECDSNETNIFRK